MCDFGFFAEEVDEGLYLELVLGEFNWASSLKYAQVNGNRWKVYSAVNPYRLGKIKMKNLVVIH